MPKRANQRRSNPKRKQTAKGLSNGSKSGSKSSSKSDSARVCKVKQVEKTLEEAIEEAIGEALDEALDDPFFYESPFPPEVVLESIEPKPVTYTPAMLARRRNLRTFVAMVVGLAVTITLLGVGKSLMNEGPHVEATSSK